MEDIVIMGQAKPNNMKNNLDESWENYASWTCENSMNDYVNGAAKFQERAIEELEKYATNWITNSIIDKRLRRAIEIIKNLKAE